jgi:hypothetical protein
MRWHCFGLMAALLLALPASAQEPPPDIPAPRIPDYHLAKVRPGDRVYFYHTEQVEGCPALTDACRRKGYVLPGDLVLVSGTKGPLAYVDYVKDGKWSAGWVKNTALLDVPIPPVSFSSWLGTWSWNTLDQDSASLEIKRDRQAGFISVHGFAFWTGRVFGAGHQRALHDGELEDRGLPNGRHIVFGKDAKGYGDCRVDMELIGPYLVADDNNQCGGLNVTFSGVYSR